MTPYGTFEQFVGLILNRTCKCRLSLGRINTRIVWYNPIEFKVCECRFQEHYGVDFKRSYWRYSEKVTTGYRYLEVPCGNWKPRSVRGYVYIERGAGSLKYQYILLLAFWLLVVVDQVEKGNWILWLHGLYSIGIQNHSLIKKLFFLQEFLLMVSIN